MQIWKKIAVALLMTFGTGFLTSFSTTAIAVESRSGSREATDQTIKIILQGMEATKNGASPTEIRTYYLKARQMAKEINSESVASLIQQGSDSLLGVSRALKPDEKGNVNSDDIMAAWQESLEIFKEIKEKQH